MATPESLYRGFERPAPAWKQYVDNHIPTAQRLAPQPDRNMPLLSEPLLNFC
jgi:hypothetical protein